MFTVLTQNLRIDVASDGINDWSHRKALVARLLQDYAADILAFQEVLAHQRRDLIAMLPGYAWSGRGREPGGEGEGCYVFWNASRFQALEQETFYLAPDPQQSGLAWDAACPRICNRVVLKAEEFPPIQIYNVHLDHIGKLARQKSIELVCARISQSAQPALVLGDFNEQKAFEHFPALTGLQDAFVVHGSDEEGTFHGFSGLPKGSPIDYILTSPEITVEFCQRLADRWEGRYPSDHFGLLAGLDFA
ncbi:endonuclease/exonuclease/phosphatase family protein [bacterium]|nr:endonuclease/exonuclease/phosphatase family protein [bacterium]